MHTGKIKRWLERGYGWIAPDDGGRDLFVHFSDIQADGYRSLVVDEHVEFEIDVDERQRERAVRVRRLDAQE